MKPRRVPPKEIFLSHSGRDRRFASRLAGELRRHHVPVWYSPTHIAGAREWHDEIGRALNRCNWFLLVLSPGAVKSEWVKRELTFALREARYRSRIVPILHKPCDPARLSWTLPGIQQLDFTAGFGGSMQALLSLWGLKYSPS